MKHIRSANDKDITGSDKLSNVEAYIRLNLHHAPWYDAFLRVEPIDKGWSCDKKYCLTVSDGTKYLLRITPRDKSATRKVQFDTLQQLEKLDIPMCKPVEFGRCESGVYVLYTWIEGADAEAVLPTLSQMDQYALGLKAGEILKKIHAIPAPDDQEDWVIRFNREVDNKIKKYFEYELRFDGDDKVIEYI